MPHRGSSPTVLYRGRVFWPDLSALNPSRLLLCLESLLFPPCLQKFYSPFSSVKPSWILQTKFMIPCVMLSCHIALVTAIPILDLSCTCPSLPPGYKLLQNRGHIWLICASVVVSSTVLCGKFFIITHYYPIPGGTELNKWLLNEKKSYT